MNQNNVIQTSIVILSCVLCTQVRGDDPIPTPPSQPEPAPIAQPAAAPQIPVAAMPEPPQPPASTIEPASTEGRRSGRSTTQRTVVRSAASPRGSSIETFALAEPGTSRNLIIRFPETDKEGVRRTILDPEMARRYGLAAPNPTMARRYGLEKASKPTSPEQVTAEKWRLEIQQLDEDLTVMSRILQKAVEQEMGTQAEERALGIVVSGTKGGRPPATYVQNHGAIFVLNVPFPLSGPDKTNVAQEKPASDSTWEETRNELFDSQRRAESVLFPGGLGESTVIQSVSDAPEAIEYDAGRVEALKRSLILALKSGVNIRHLGSKDLITLVVAQGKTGSSRAIAFERYGLAATHQRLTRAVEKAMPSEQNQQLVIQVSKSDIVEFAEDQIQADEFTRRAKVALY